MNLILHDINGSILFYHKLSVWWWLTFFPIAELYTEVSLSHFSQFQYTNPDSPDEFHIFWECLALDCFLQNLYPSCISSWSDQNAYLRLCKTYRVILLHLNNVKTYLLQHPCTIYVVSNFWSYDTFSVPLSLASSRTLQSEHLHACCSILFSSCWFFVFLTFTNSNDVQIFIILKSTSNLFFPELSLIRIQMETTHTDWC